MTSQVSKWSKFKRIESDIPFVLLASRQKVMWLVADTQKIKATVKATETIRGTESQLKCGNDRAFMI